ncbi:MAG TPA: ABC transporter substrate-binding protein [Reyranella sp.]|nr:ABC transporter substrate-binding protein [Reyranella sp.]
MTKLLPSRRAFLGATALAAAPALGRAQSLRRFDLLIDWKAAPTYAGFFLAREAGAFRRRGLDVRIVEGRGASVAADLVGEGGEHWLASSSAAATAISRSKGLPVKSLAVYYNRTPTVLYSRAEAPLRGPRDLPGKRIGLVPGSITVEEYRGLLAANGLARSQMTEVAVDWEAKSLLDGKVDALLDYEEIVPAELESRGHRIHVMRLADFGVRTYSLNLIVNETAWHDPERRETAAKINAAVQEGYRLVHDKPAEAAAIFGKLFPVLTPRYLAVSLPIVARELNPSIGRQTRLGWEDTLRSLSSLGLLVRPVSVDEVAIWE